MRAQPVGFAGPAPAGSLALVGRACAPKGDTTHPFLTCVDYLVAAHDNFAQVLAWPAAKLNETGAEYAERAAPKAPMVPASTLPQNGASTARSPSAHASWNGCGMPRP